MKILILAAIGWVMLPLASALANDSATQRTDNMIAAGVVFKLAYSFQSEPASEQNTDEACRFLQALANDLTQLSKTEHGKKLAAEGGQLLSSLLAITNKSPESAKAMEFFGAKPDQVAELATGISEKIASFARLSRTPEWVYDPTKRKPFASDKPSEAPQSPR